MKPSGAPPVYRPTSALPRNSFIQQKASQQTFQSSIGQLPDSNGRQHIKLVAPGGMTAGSVDLSADSGGRFQLSDLRVAEVYRKQGLGGRLVQSALQAARNRGARSVQLEARPSDSSISPGNLHRMYQKFGFRNIAISGRGNPIMEYAIQPRMLSERVATFGAPPIYRPTAPAQARPAVPTMGGSPLVYHPADFSSRGFRQIDVNRRGYPQIGAAVGPVLTGVAQRRGCLQLMQDPQKDPNFKVNYYRSRLHPPPPSTRRIPWLQQSLGALDPNSIFNTLKNPGDLAQAPPEGDARETKRFVPKQDYAITSFFVRKPKENPGGDPQHWAMYFKVEGTKREKWIKVDLIRDEYRVIYHANVIPMNDFSGTDDHHGVNGLTVPRLYQLLSTVARAKGRLTGNKGPDKYNCQDFVLAMLEELKQYQVKPLKQVTYPVGY